MEKYFTLPTPDWYEINWVLNWKGTSDKLIIFVHWLTGSMNEAHYYCAKNYFTERWYEVVRFNLYTDWEKTRKLKNTTIKHHSQDIETVLLYFETDYTHIFLVWHSLAWPSIVWMNKFSNSLKKIVFWDPAFDTSISALKCREEWGKLIRSWSGKDVEIFQEMYEEFTENKHLENLRNISFSKNNLSIIYAEKDIHKNTKPMTDEMWIDSVIIDWANHGFTQEWKFEELFEKTLEFINK